MLAMQTRIWYNLTVKLREGKPKTRKANKMNETEKKQKLVDYINGMGVEEKIALHNAYCDADNSPDDRIYELDELEEVLDGVEKWTLVNMIRFGDFDFLKDFWGFNGYGNLDSYGSWELPIFASDIAGYILSHEDSLGNDEIQYMLDREINF